MITNVLITCFRRLQSFVRKQLLLSVAVIIKRGWLEMSKEERYGIITSISQLLQMHDYGVCFIQRLPILLKLRYKAPTRHQLRHCDRG